MSELFKTDHYEINENEMNVADELIKFHIFMMSHLLTQQTFQHIFYQSLRVIM